MKEGSPNKERGGCIGAGSLQSQPGVNLHPNTANKRVRVAKGGKADGVALTLSLDWFQPSWGEYIRIQC